VALTTQQEPVLRVILAGKVLDRAVLAKVAEKDTDARVRAAAARRLKEVQ